MESYRTGAVTCEEIGRRFEEFCHTKGIEAKFQVTFAQTGGNAVAPQAHDKARTEAAKNSTENERFKEFMPTEGLKAECRLVIENMKLSSETSNSQTAKEIAKLKAETRAVIAAHGAVTTPSDFSAEKLSAEFNAFLKEKGLGEMCSVQIVKE